ncbi:MAG: hypothetical protein U0269_08530 [Polyangiales bacterium]
MVELIQVEVEDAELSTLDGALARWWDALLEHAASQRDANRLVADAWAETGRLIGHVQTDAQPIGTDRGLRVILTVRSLARAVSEAAAAPSVVHSAREALFAAFERSRRKLVSEGRFASLWDGRAGCFWCEDGALMAEPSLIPAAPRPKRRRT